MRNRVSANRPTLPTKGTSRGIAGVVPELRARLGDEICIVFRHRAGDPAREEAARAAESAAVQGRFWPFHDALVRGTGAPDALRAAASEARLNLRRFDDDRRAALTADRVHEDAEDLEGVDPEEAPVLFVQGRRYSGPRDTDSLVGALDLARGARAPLGAE